MQILNFDECALVIVLIFLISILLRKEYKGRTNFILLIMILAIFFSVLTDLVGGSITNHATPSPAMRIALYAMNYVYFFAHNLVLTIFIMYMYSSVDIWHVFRSSKRMITGLIILNTIDIIVLLLNGWVIDVFSIDENLNYIRGPWLAIFYVVAAIMVVWVVHILYIYRSYVNKDKRRVLLFLFIVIVSSLAIQFFYGNMLVEGIAMSLAILFFMVIVKREESQINPITGAMKYTEGIDRVTKNLASKKPVSIILIKLINNNNLHLYLGLEGHNKFLRYTTEKLNELSHECNYHAELFYLEDGLYAFLGEETEDDIIRNVANRCKAMFDEECHFDKFTVMTDVIICAATAPDEISDISTFLSLCSSFHETLRDSHKVYFYKDIKDNKEFKIRNDMHDIIKRALDHNGLIMYYQPIYSVEKKRFVAAEALIRLHDRVYGKVPASMFIPEAEANGMIHEIGEFVLDNVIGFISKSNIAQYGIDYIDINLSASQCIETDLVDKIMDTLDKYDVKPEMVSFELTEASTDINPDIVDNNIRRLHDMGVKIALDGYGTGYSNMRRVTQLPIDQVKLDKSFVDMINDPQLWTLVSDTVSMLKEMGKEVVIEGIEDEAVAQKFTELDADLIQGCDLIQGFYFCKPIPSDEFVAYLDSVCKEK